MYQFDVQIGEVVSSRNGELYQVLINALTVHMVFQVFFRCVESRCDAVV
jgi:hypothetical protein